MDHLSEVLKILDGALRHNLRLSFDYAGLLAEKLEAEGQRDQARRIRERLARTPQQMIAPQAGVNMGLPVDQESRLATVDEFSPRPEDVRLILPDGIARRLNEFVAAIRHHDRLEAAGVALPARLLLFGPPGCGKTLAATWVAAQLKLPLLTARCDTLVSSLLGQTARNLRRVFDHVQDRPCVLLLDEFDALAKARSDEREVGELQRVVIALLQNMDALPPSTILIAATNHESLLDPAVWRRFAFHVAMPLPDTELRESLWRQRLGRYAPSDINWPRLVALSDGLSGAAIEQVAQDALRGAVIAGDQVIHEAELLRRLGLTLAMNLQTRLPQIADEVRWLRAWQPKVFTIRTLATLYTTTQRQIRNMTTGKQGDREQPDSED
jgi:SpoVK/Ycf46/Vps4 family AAA+-type ATPase